jgi:signal transduction histidine kinase
VEPPASQGLMFAVFLFMFAGIALGITRYRLFELDRWWFQAWSWFLGGLAVILVDFALAAYLRLSQVGALGLSLALVGWVYFPLRQAVWSRWQRKAINDRQDRFGQWMLALFSTTREDALQAQWHAVLRGEFAPLELVEAPGSASKVQVSEDGLTLTVPALKPGHAVTLRHPARGSRLFRREDLAAAEVLVGMGRRALEAQREREQGALAERGRILRDLHDDLGAKLLSLVYLTSGGEGEPLARSAVRDMRDVLEALEATPCVLAEAVAEWRAEAQARADTVGFALAWEADGLPEQRVVSARQRTNISRILREAITNALKHARARHVTVRIGLDARGLALAVEDDGAAGAVEPERWRAGLGTRVIRQRAADLGGVAQWGQGTRGCRLEVTVPLEAAVPA